MVSCKYQIFLTRYLARSKKTCVNRKQHIFYSSETTPCLNAPLKGWRGYHSDTPTNKVTRKTQNLTLVEKILRSSPRSCRFFYMLIEKTVLNAFNEFCFGAFSIMGYSRCFPLSILEVKISHNAAVLISRSNLWRSWLFDSYASDGAGLR